MAKKHYDIEREGQIDFFDNYGIDYLGNNTVLIDDTDGIYNGNILEFKLNISDINKVLFQVIKYLSHMRIKGESVPARILLIDLNATTVYVFKSQKYLKFIEKVYTGSASINDAGFAGDNTPEEILNYSNMVDSNQLKHYLIDSLPESKKYIRVHIDENDIVGWATRYYKELPKATKGNFLGDDTGKINVVGEIREPKHFKNFIYPYKETTNEKFKYLMDCLNDRLNKKDLGAFYTPAPYARKAAELVQKAVEKVPDGNDYIILDRCAGTGNLEAPLANLYDKNGDSLLSHAVVSTYEYYEYKVLWERIGNKVRDIIPPTENDVEYENGKVFNANAMSENFIENPIIRKYIDDKHYTIILFENPPYRDDISANTKRRKNVKVRVPFVQQELKKDLSNLPNSNISTARDLSNQFVWSAFKYYLRQDTDSYILFSPIKYWKSLGLADVQFNGGFLFNRHHFHATASAIACIWWQNENNPSELIQVHAFDLDKNNNFVDCGEIKISKTHQSFRPLFDKRTFSNDVKTEVYCERNGEQSFNRKCDGTSYTNDNILAYLQTQGFSIDPKHVCLTRMTTYNIRGFYLRRDKYLADLPLFVAKEFPQDNWYDRDVYFNTSDDGIAYTKDKEFLKQCLIYTILSNQNKCLTFEGSDKRLYQNELCLDNTNFTPQAKKDLDKIILTDEEKKLVALFSKILAEAKQTKNYKANYTYGVYQITQQLNTHHKDGNGARAKTVYDYPTLNGDLKALATLLKQYYLNNIKNNMFKYQLVK